MPEILPTIDPTPPAAAPRPSSNFSKAILLKGLFFGVLAMLIAESLRTLAFSNFLAVTPGRCYRGAQPTGTYLDNAHRAYGIRSILNLRGNDNENDVWFKEEDATAKRLGITLYDAGLSSTSHAPRKDFARFVQAVKDAQEPILIHCANGNDRSGLAAAVYLILRTDTPVNVARKQLSLRHGHFYWTKAGCLHRILDNYERWLRENQWEHTPDRFYHWGVKVYEPED